METLCYRCKAAMNCKRSGECWCAAVPPALLLPNDESAGCFCPKCLCNSIASAETLLERKEECRFVSNRALCSMTANPGSVRPLPHIFELLIKDVQHS